MIQYQILEGGKHELAEKIRDMYNEPNFEIVNIIYSTFCDDVFSIETIHHAIVYFINKAVE